MSQWQYFENNSMKDIAMFYQISVDKFTLEIKKVKKTRIEPVGEPYREVCLSPWKGNWRISKNRIDWRNVLLSEKNYFHEKELKENGNMT